MKYFPLFLLVILVSISSPSFAERGGGGRDFNRGGGRGMDQRHDNWNRRNWEGNINVNPQVIVPQGPGYYNYNPFPDDTEQDEIYQENLRN